VRVVILTRTAHAGFGKAKGKARSKTKTTFVKFLIKLFFKKFVGCGAKPHDLQPDAHSVVFLPPPGGGGKKLNE
jgi:hypothetical protein